MKWIFLGCFVVLSIASLATWWQMPETRSDVPVLYWVTDNNPVRAAQVQRFHDWLAKQDCPPFELRIDSANSDPTKKIIQGVSGAAGDIMDVAGFDLQYFQAVGLLHDVTDAAKQLGFGPERTFAAVQRQITIDDRQYLFPCNVWGGLLFVNKDAFRRLNLPLPPQRWTLEEFEEHGRRFVEAAKRQHQPQRVFFAASVNPEVLRRSLGLSVYNETLTRCVLDDARNVRVLKLIRKWTEEDHLLPTAADTASFATASGYGGASTQLFCSGQFAMLDGGLHLLIQFRQSSSPVEMGIGESPNGGYPNVLVGTRAAGVYAGSRHKDLACYFLAFLASEQYNLSIIESADALPPNPLYTRDQRFLAPVTYPNEWEVRGGFAKAFAQIAIPYVTSPYVLHSVASRVEEGQYNGFMSGITSAEEAAREMQRQINAEIDRTLREQPALLPAYREQQSRQAQIEALRARGEKVPLEWVVNPFYRQYYLAMGWAAGDKHD